MIPTKRVLPTYSSKFSKKDYTQHQLAVSVCLKAYEDKVYRDAADFLSEIGQYLGFELGKTPNFSTLQKFVKRIPLRILDFILRKTYEVFFQTKVANIGVDSTGEKTSHTSAHYTKRMKRKSRHKDYLKHSISVDTDQQAIMVAKDRRSGAHDTKDYKHLVKKSREIVPLNDVTADKGYDSEENHKFTREDVGAKSVIPPRWENVPLSRTKGKYRRMMKRRFPKKRYHRRSMNETVNFVEKTKFGEELRSKKWWMKKKEQRLKDIAYNIYRHMRVCNFVAAVSTTGLRHFFEFIRLPTKMS
jgi:Transposase DDE domain